MRLTIATVLLLAAIACLAVVLAAGPKRRAAYSVASTALALLSIIASFI